MTDNFDKTTHFGGWDSGISGGSSQLVTIFDGMNAPKTIDLGSFNKRCVYFGRSDTNDIVLSSMLVSREHGRFLYDNGIWIIQDKSAYSQQGSQNGLLYNNSSIRFKLLNDGDFIRIDDGVETVANGVLFIFSANGSINRWDTLHLNGRSEITIGRVSNSDIVLPHISVSKCHARITFENGSYYIYDNNSTNGVIVNNMRLHGKRRLQEKDVIVITNSKLIFTSAAIHYCCFRSGISVDTENVVITRKGKGGKRFITGDNISLNIKPGELISIIGGSGAGKSTILNAMSGYLPPTEGNVYINGTNLYQNFDSLKKLIGYVPQSDIVYDNLTLKDMLTYTAKLRLPSDISDAERNEAIDRAIDLVELNEKKNSFIKALSGGQKKRASIAVELLSDPNLLFLDEPASGLDPGTERNLMTSLRKMADSGKTVILVTHSTLQLKLCDKILFMGKGGKLCFFGSHDDALKFFGVSDVVDIYNMITDNADYWRSQYNAKAMQSGSQRGGGALPREKQTKKKVQLPVLCARYIKLVVNDKQRLLLLLIQAPLLALLISFVKNGKQFEQYDITKSLLFSLSCSAFWVGMLNAIQEICKERSILKREYMTGLSLNAYVLSKIIVLGVLCLIQSALIILVFSLTVGLPENGLFLPPAAELFLTTFLTAAASTAMGLFVSSLFTNPDRAMTVAPLLLMPQMLFSGLLFKLSGATEIISWLTVCRWSMEGYGTTANLNDLPMKLQQEGLPLVREAESFFEYTKGHMFKVWIILILFVAVFLLFARVVLRNVGKEKS